VFFASHGREMYEHYHHGFVFEVERARGELTLTELTVADVVSTME